MGSGYVMDFSNRTFSEFFRESARVDIYSDKYAANGDSKAKRLRAFIELEADPLSGRRLLIFWSTGDTKRRSQTPRKRLLLNGQSK